MLNGVDGIDFSALSELFGNDIQPEPLPVDDGITHDDGNSGAVEKPDDSQIENTKAFSKRLNEKTEKARIDERERIAKEFGFDSYASMTKERERKLLEEKGLTPDEVAPVVEEIVKKRLNDDPRMQELAAMRKKQTEEFAKQELAKLSKLTDGAITDLNQVPKDVIDEWTKTGSLTKAYMTLHGEELLVKVKSGQSNGSTNHLKTPGSGSVAETGKRPLTKDEIKVWKMFNPKMTDEELSKVMVEK